MALQTNSVVTAPQLKSSLDVLTNSVAGDIYTDSTKRIFQIMEIEGDHRAVFMGSGWPSLGITFPTYPLTRAPKGSTVTYAQG